MKFSRLSRTLYRAARLSRDAAAIESGSPAKIARRAENRLLGRLLARAGFWRALWRRR